MAYRSLREFLDRLEGAGELVRVKERVDPFLEMAALADRAAKQGGPRAPLREPRLGRLPRRDEPVRHAAPHELGALDRRLRGPRAGAAGPPPPGAAPVLLGQAQDAAEAREARLDGAEAGLLRRLAGGGGPRARPPEAPGAHHLAARRRALRHAPPGHHPRSRDRDPQRRDVPAPGPRAAPPRDALAAPQDRDRPLPRLQEEGRAHARRHRPRRRPGAHLLRLRAAPAQRRRVPLRRLPPRRGGPDGEGRRDRARRPRRRRPRHRGLRRHVGAARPRRPLRRPHRLLLPRRRLPRPRRRGGDAPPRSDLPGDGGRAAAGRGPVAREGDGAALPARCSS